MLASVSCDSTSAPPAANQSIDGTESDENQTCVTTGCDDGNACTVDRCEVFAGNYACRHIPQECDPGRTCDPDSGACVECFSGSDCSDGQFCNGEETCDAGTCGLGISPCGKSACDEVVDECAFCLLDADCDDEVFCNGVELCSNGVCEAGEAPCAGTCDEELDSCGDEFAARIVGCLPSSVYFDVGVPLTAQVDGGFGERTNIEWSIEAEHATLTSTRSPSTSLLIPEEEDIVVKLIATDDAQVEGE